jgi:hypothetical protein
MAASRSFSACTLARPSYSFCRFAGKTKKGNPWKAGAFIAKEMEKLRDQLVPNIGQYFGCAGWSVGDKQPEDYYPTCTFGDREDHSGIVIGAAGSPIGGTINNHKSNIPAEGSCNQIAVHMAEQINYALSTGRRGGTNRGQNESIGLSSVGCSYVSAHIGTKH